jgi:hypothetical protein
MRRLFWVPSLVAAEAVLCAHLSREPMPSTRAGTCASIRSDRWNLLPGVEFTGLLRIDLAAGPGASLALVVGDSLPPDLEVESANGPTPLVATRITPEVAPGDYWLEFGNPWQAPSHIVAATIDAYSERARTVTLNLGRRAPRVLARTAGYPPDARARICAAQSRARKAFANAEDLTITPGRAEYFASGWYDVEPASRQASAVRWMSEYGVLLVPSARDGDVRLRLQATPAVADARAERPRLTVTVNDVFDSVPIEMSAETGEYEWVVPARSWVVGTNEVLFRISRTQPPAVHGSERRTLGLAFRQLYLSIRE